MGLYCGVDLHSTNSYLAVLNEQLQPVLSRRVPNRLDAVLGALEPFREQVQAIAVESTFNWYWLVDGLLEAGYQVRLVNTSAVRQYEGLKYLDDRHDARWLARLLHLGILPTGHIYPKKERALRDLLTLLCQIPGIVLPSVSGVDGRLSLSMALLDLADNFFRVLVVARQDPSQENLDISCA